MSQCESVKSLGIPIVIVDLSHTPIVNLAKPKSVTLGMSSDIKSTFDGLRSR